MDDARYDGVLVRQLEVEQDWIDFNGHMNVAYYVLAFDRAVDGLWEHFGMNEHYRDSSNGSTFAVECHIRYLRELAAGDPIAITAQVVGYDEKRIHQYQRMYHASAGYLAATCEWMNLHVDLTTRRVSEWPPEVAKSIAAFAAREENIAVPQGLGSVMRVPPGKPGKTET